MPNSRSEEKMYALEGAALKRAQKTYPDAMSYYYLDSLGKNQEFILQLPSVGTALIPVTYFK